MKKNHNSLAGRKAQRVLKSALATVLVLSFLCIPAFATPASNPVISAIDNLADFFFLLIRAIGIIAAGFGVVQVAMSISSHDPSQRTNGFLFLAGGLIIIFTKEILSFITGGAV